MAIGIFDSGIGGLNVLGKAMNRLPDADFIYYADTENVPYSYQKDEDIFSYVKEAVDFLISQGADIVVLACNTATSVAVARLREIYRIPIIGMEPAVKPAVEKTKEETEKILITATPVTLRLEKLENLIQQLNAREKVDFLPLPGLVEFAEKGIFSGDEVVRYLQDEIAKVDLEHLNAVVLGCTHFIFYEKVLSEVLPQNIVYYDGVEGTVNQLINILNKNQIKLENNDENHVRFFDSGKEVTGKRQQFYRDLVNFIREARD